MTVKSGPIEPLKLFKVFRSLAERQLSGVLTVRRGSVVKQAQVVGGQPYRSASNVQSEGLMWGLVEEGLISSTEKIQVEERAAREQVRPEVLLVSLDLVAHARLASVERRLSRRRLAEAFGWADGEFSFEPRALTPPGDVDPIDPVHLMLEAAARYLPAALPARFVRMYPGQLVCPTPLFEAHGQHYDRYYPPPNLRRYLQQPAAVERLTEVHGDPEDVARQVFTLVVSGLCQFSTAEEWSQRSRPPPPPHRPPPVPPSPSVPPPPPAAAVGALGTAPLARQPVPAASFVSAVPVAQTPPRSATGSMAAATPTHTGSPGPVRSAAVKPVAPVEPAPGPAAPPGPPRVGMRGAPVGGTASPGSGGTASPGSGGTASLGSGATIPPGSGASMPLSSGATVPPAQPAPGRQTAGPAAAAAVRPANAGRQGQGGGIRVAASPVPRAPANARSAGGSLVAERPAAGEVRRGTPERAAPPAEVLARLEQAKVLFRTLETADHYAVLGLQRSATPDAIRQSFRQLASQFHSDRYVRFAISEADRAVVQKVFIAINKASETLGDAARRREYDAGLDVGIKPSTPGGAAAQIDQVFKAEKLVRDAVLLLRNNQAQPALEKLDEALAITADDPLAQAARLFADFTLVQARGAAPQMAARTRDALKAITAVYQGRDEPFVYLGRVHRQLGENDAACAAFEAALRANPRCAEAASELRFLQRHAPKSEKTGDSSRSGGLFGMRKK